MFLGTLLGRLMALQVYSRVHSDQGRVALCTRCVHWMEENTRLDRVGGKIRVGRGSKNPKLGK